MFPNSPDQWGIVLQACGVPRSRIPDWAEPFFEVVTVDRFNMGEAELDDYLSQTLYETNNLAALVEDLNYSAGRIQELAALYGPASRWGAAGRQAADLAGNPEALAEVLYGGRFGNVNPGDGWKFRGRGIPMLTFHDNYARVGQLMGQDLTVNPELLEQKRFALDASLHWWDDKIPDSAIDHPDRQRKLVQGSTLGLDRVRNLAASARLVLGRLA
jgi:putative chitinase